ncbi:hypothetical protein SSP35_22_00500 [Streptomyces sp. NBRC 110611]|uniref:hypothetical protein n=1 Tax=Streptomyces sp. NBRC 110611 TaxID=1621259 RepID=UPI00082EC8D4|nr:hypothetical protein [Streptomyces sp. NBRC 110611]GAU70747.1 hypothetical protein SSP35_22_00500 [Streptomyces sp. NBRC 110611]
MPCDTHPSQIALAVSLDAGIVAIPFGEQHMKAQTALRACGFGRRPDGTYARPAADSEATRTALARLTDIARYYDTAVTTATRRYIGDVADGIAHQLPGEWTADVEIYALPDWQDDLHPYVWDNGELAQAVATTRIPYAAVLTHSDGPSLLLTERPEADRDYLVGVFAPSGFVGHFADEPDAPRSIAIPAQPSLAAHAITGHLLPDYHRALHDRRIHEVSSSLSWARQEQQEWQSIAQSRRDSDGMPLTSGQLSWHEEEFRDDGWNAFRDFVTHGPALFDRCQPLCRKSGDPHREDGRAMERLRTALEDGKRVVAAWNAKLAELRETPRTLPAETYLQARARRNADAWPAIETWVADGHVLIHHARSARSALPSAALTTPRQTTGAALPSPPAPKDPPRRR